MSPGIQRNVRSGTEFCEQSIAYALKTMTRTKNHTYDDDSTDELERGSTMRLDGSRQLSTPTPSSTET